MTGSFPPAANTYVSEGTIDLTGVHNVHLCSNALAAGHGVDAQSNERDLIVVVPVTTPYGVMNYWRSNQHLLSFVDYDRPRPMNSVDIRLTDHHGRVLELPSNSEVHVELMVVFKSS